MGRNADKLWRDGGGGGAGEEKEETGGSGRANKETTLLCRHHRLPLDATAGAFVGPDLKEFDRVQFSFFFFSFLFFDIQDRSPRIQSI